MHAFRSGIVDAAAALQNWADSRSGARKGRRVGFPRFKKRDRSVPTVSFVEINHQLSWLHPDRHHVRLMLPRSTPDPEVRRRRDQLAWLHTVSTRPLYNLVDSGKATIQKVTLAKRGGRWQASLLVRYQTVPVPGAEAPGPWARGVDVGVRHLATLSDPVGGVTDTDGHVTNPNVLAGQQLRRLVKLDRAVARAQTGSKTAEDSSDGGPASTAGSPRHGPCTSTSSPTSSPAASTSSPSRTSTWPAWPTAHAGSAGP